MKKRNWFDKGLFAGNLVFAVLLLLAYLLPWVPAKSFPILAVLSLAFPLLVLVNIGFLLFWLLRFKKQWLLSLLVILVGFGMVRSLYVFGGKKPKATLDDALTVMSYNVRLFNLYDWIDDPLIQDKIVELVTKESPEVLCVQEFLVETKNEFKQYPYSYIKPRSKNNKMGLAIFSKHEIVDSGSLDFPNTSNNGVFADILYKKDTIRVYNLHLESLKIDTQTQELTQENSEKLLKRISSAFVKQEQQGKAFALHTDQHGHPQIVCGDLNNTAYSHAYKLVRGEMKDAFLEAGSGFGKTFNYKSLPIRIDFIFSSEGIEVQYFENLYPNYSDHFPIIAHFELQ